MLIEISIGDSMFFAQWPMGMGLPRWGESFEWKGTNFMIGSAGWVMEEVEADGLEEGRFATMIRYSVSLVDELDCDECAPGIEIYR